MRTRPEDFEWFLNRLKSIAPAEMEKNMDEQAESSKQEYQQFKDSYSKKKCYLCSQNLTRCDYSTPCLHWLFRSHKRIKKKHIQEALQTRGILEVIAYLRWAANYEFKLSGINDFEGYELRPEVFFQETIQWKNVTWTFWIKNNDLTGHPRKLANYPHYHIQMTIDGRNFINFGDLHIPLTEWDIYNLHLRKGAFPGFKHSFPFGESYGDLLTNLSQEQLLSGMKSTDKENRAQFHLQTSIEAGPGELLSGNDLADLVKESKATKIPLAKLAKEKFKNATVSTYIEPMNLVEPATRTKTKSGR